jgi:hypothetical protein
LPVASRWVIVAVYAVSVYREDRTLLLQIPRGFNGGALLLLRQACIQFLPVFGTDEGNGLLIDLILPLYDVLKLEDVLCLGAPRLDL